MLDWDHLRFFLAVARHGTLSAAARALKVAQPTVGRRITALEEQLGARLFDRTPTAQSLTATGRRLLAHAERMEADVLEIERVATGRDSGIRGRVRVTASEWMVDRVLAPLVPPLLARHPGLEIELLADGKHLSLLRREADLAVRPSAFEHQDVVQRDVGRLAFGLYASHAYLARRGVPDFADEGAGHALVAMSEALDKIPDVAWLPAFAARAQVVARCNGRLPMVTLAMAGVGMACLPRFVGDISPGLRLLATPVPAPTRTLWLGVHRDARAIPRVRATLRHLAGDLARLSEIGGAAEDAGAPARRRP